MTKDPTRRPFLPRWANDIDGLGGTSDSLDASTVTVEFPDGSTPLSVSRREFLRVAGVAAASAGIASACSYPADHVVPYLQRPDGVYHDTPGTFTTVCKGCSAGCGLLMTVREGRVVKVEGNPKHPMNTGAVCGRGHGSVLDLYSPDATRTPQLVGRGDSPQETTWAELDKGVADSLKKGGKVRVLTGTLTGSGELATIGEFVGAASDGRHVMWEPLAPTDARDAHAAIYGAPTARRVRFDVASAIVSFGADFLGTWRTHLEATRQYASTRAPERKAGLSRLTVFEGAMTLTGAMADRRVATPPSVYTSAALAVAHELIVVGKVGRWASDGAVTTALQPFSVDAVAQATGLSADSLKAAAAELKAAGRRGLAVGADLGARGLAAVMALINESLDNGGVTTVPGASYQYGCDADPAVTPAVTAGGYKAMAALVAELNAGDVELLVISDVNPIYDAPPALKFAEAVKKAKKVVYVGQLVNETAHSSDHFAAAPHPLECWGDSHPVEKVWALQQPGLTPLGSSRSLFDSLITWSMAAGGSFATPAFALAADKNAKYVDPQKRPAPGPFYYYLRNSWAERQFETVVSPLGFDSFWEDALRAGAFVESGALGKLPTANFGEAVKALPKAPPNAQTDQVQLIATPLMYDGRNAHNGVLQETPDPITQVAWGSYVGVAPARFTAMALKPGDMLAVTTKDAKLELPAVMMPGLPKNVFAIPVGYGRTKAGVVGSDLGANAFTLSEAGPGGIGYVIGVQVAKTGGFEQLGIPMGKGHVVDLSKRHIVPVATYDEYKKDPKAGAHYHTETGLWGDHEYKVKWGMAIDLSRCTGCSACVVSCYVENNVPVAGKSGIVDGRTMSWLRIDRYYRLPDGGDYSQAMLDPNPEVAAASHLENPQVLIEPMLCQQCTNAPCESVCPVLATVHSSEGLNEQVYNRCVGTRYCANNCPYKVRRYNWFNYSVDRSEEFFASVYPELKEHAAINVKWPAQLRYNPEVTVRTRGVMEKCSFCVQRIRKASPSYKRLGIAEPVLTACQESCPADAISFGDTMDEKTTVAKHSSSPRSFMVLSHLNTVPAVKYLTRVTNG